MDPHNLSLDPFLKLADSLGELEVTVGRARAAGRRRTPQRLRAAVGARARRPGGLAGALRGAMERLAAIASDLDPAEGAMMRMIAQSFTEALRQATRAPPRRRST